MTKWITAAVGGIIIAVVLVVGFVDRTPVDRQAYFASTSQFDAGGWVLFLGVVPVVGTKVMVLYDLRSLSEVDRVDLTYVLGREGVSEAAVSRDGRHVWMLGREKLALFSLDEERDSPIGLVGVTRGRFKHPFMVTDNGLRLGVWDEESRTDESIVNIELGQRPDGQLVLRQSLWRNNASSFFGMTVVGFRLHEFFLMDDHRFLEMPLIRWRDE